MGRTGSTVPTVHTTPRKFRTCNGLEVLFFRLRHSKDLWLRTCTGCQVLPYTRTGGLGTGSHLRNFPIPEIGLPGKLIIFYRIFPNPYLLTENQFSGKTYFHTLASRRREGEPVRCLPLRRRALDRRGLQEWIHLWRTGKNCKLLCQYENCNKICLKSLCTASTALLALIEMQGLLRQILHMLIYMTSTQYRRGRG